MSRDSRPGHSRRKGYSMIEAMVSVAVLSIGIVSVIGAYGALTNQQRQANMAEHMQKLALDKYDELMATQSLQTQSLNGDFSDRGDDGYTWTADIAATGTNDLSALTVTVEARSGGSQQSVTGVVYIPPQTTTAGATP